MNMPLHLEGLLLARSIKLGHQDPEASQDGCIMAAENVSLAILTIDPLRLVAWDTEGRVIETIDIPMRDRRRVERACYLRHTDTSALIDGCGS